MLEPVIVAIGEVTKVITDVGDGVADTMIKEKWMRKVS